MFNTLLLGEYISLTTSFSLISQGFINHVCLCRLYVFLFHFNCMHIFFIINTVFVFLMYVCSSVYVFFIMLFYFVGVLSTSIYFNLHIVFI